MQRILVNFVRALRSSRFTIDVLTLRLDDLNSARAPETERAAEAEDVRGILVETQQTLQTCDRLHSRLCAELTRVAHGDSGALTSLRAGFKELSDKITRSITRLNSVQFRSRTA